VAGEETRWSWQTPQAAVDPKGDLSWQPQPFRFVAGDSVRYIDYDGGDDTNPGDHRDKPWKHHPWDPEATGRAKEAQGVHTYVFRRGVTYRGRLVSAESGRPDAPIRLTSDPSWGDGEAVLSGSERVGTWTRGADHPDIPEPGRVWWTDLPFAPRSLWQVDPAGHAVRVPLARTPNWQVVDPDDVKSQWWHWDYKGTRAFDVFTEHRSGKLHLGIDTANLTQPAEYYQDAILWTEHGWVMGGPYPTRVVAVDTERRGLAFSGRWGGVGAYKIVRFNRYFLEDKPHYLDDDRGEFWFQRKGSGGRLYLRPPDGADPNTLSFEAARHGVLLDSLGMSHVEITGLTFRFTNPYWRIEGLPYMHNPDLDTACIRVLGDSRGVRVAHCRFEHVQSTVRMIAPELDDVIDRVVIEDNDVHHTDRGAFYLSDGSPWAETERVAGLLGDVRIMRNRLEQIGLRPTRFDIGIAINLHWPKTVEIAGNIIDRCYSGGINVYGGKRGGSVRDCPLSRILIHHNKVTDSILSTDDVGGIETWQGGPAYVWNNISGNPGGYRHFYKLAADPLGRARFGFAYYLDGAFKNYYFNNIAWGKSSDPTSPLANKAAFQEIHSYQNTFFHNTACSFVEGSRRQRPEGGRNKYLANIFHDISMNVFWHSDRTGTAPNVQDAGTQEDDFDYSTNAYSRNVLHGVGKAVGVFEADGTHYDSLGRLADALARRQAIAADVGRVTDKPPLRNAAAGDFRPAADGQAQGRGARVFVPWALTGVVAEWNFYHAGGDPSRILDEHWYLTPYHVHRDGYRHRPMYPLTAVNIRADDYVTGPLEDWVAGALALNGKDQYARIANATMTEPFHYEVTHTDGRQTRTEPRTAKGEELRNPQIHRSNFLVEVFFRTEPGHTGGLLVRKMNDTAGYHLGIDQEGRLAFSVRGPDGVAARLVGKGKVNDGQWKHAIAEADRAAGTLALYVDGREDARGGGLDGTVSMANDADLYVGGTPDGGHLAGTLDFMRIAMGTLADAGTTIEELYAWQFDGPFLRDFTGRPRPSGPRSAAGAIEPGD
jgi:hypothetical protein